MAGFSLRKNQRLKQLVPVRYQMLNGIADEGIMKDLSLSGSYMTGNVPVSVGMALALQIFVPGDPDVVLIDQATVKWVKGSTFGVNFETLPPKVAAQITKIIATLIQRTTWPIKTDSTPC